jgi:hypothetical protein
VQGANDDPLDQQSNVTAAFSALSSPPSLKSAQNQSFAKPFKSTL